jgi:hypothetical protein
MEYKITDTFDANRFYRLLQIAEFGGRLDEKLLAEIENQQPTELNHKAVEG